MLRSIDFLSKLSTVPGRKQPLIIDCPKTKCSQNLENLFCQMLVKDMQF